MNSLRKLLLTFAIDVAAVGVTLLVLPGMSYSGGWQGIVTITAILAGVNLLIRPILALLTLPVEIATVAVLTLVANAGMLVILSSTMAGFSLYPFPFPGFLQGSFTVSPFTVPAWGTAVLGALSIAFIVSVLSWLTGLNHKGHKSHHWVTSLYY